jgi:hypothetical protein
MGACGRVLVREEQLAALEHVHPALRCAQFGNAWAMKQHGKGQPSGLVCLLDGQQEAFTSLRLSHFASME